MRCPTATPEGWQVGIVSSGEGRRAGGGGPVGGGQEEEVDREMMGR